jgi:predicted PurR-regulated permease PerM
MVEQSRPFLYLLIGLASVFIIIAGIQNLAFILNPILLSIVITITVLPLPEQFSKRGVPGWLSLVLTFVVVLGVIGLVLFLVFIGLARVSEWLPSIQATIAASLAAEETTEAVPDSVVSFISISLNDLGNAITSLIASERLTNVAAGLLRSLLVGISQAFLVLLIFAFMLSSALALPSSARLGLRTDHPMLHQAATLTVDVRRYVTLTTFINLLTAIGNTILLLIMGVDLALLWGLLSWFMGYIPAIGFWIAMIPPLILAYVEHGFASALIVFVGYTLINGTVENLVKPRMMGQQLKISPVVVVISLFVWGWLLGAVGAILSTPLTLLILSILEAFDSTRWIAILLRANGGAESGDQMERQAAFGRVRGVWNRAVTALRGGPPSPIESARSTPRVRRRRHAPGRLTNRAVPIDCQSPAGSGLRRSSARYRRLAPR